ncbi:twin-arginine translocase TatA/TatE family subunit [Alsobacter sp. KACC 23698]|jgi:sec-independent protein translocase protein TatA|uniref:Sec-independent protein translocase protein TatA n=1 Tax=Alsobacter sp. KACC 23698 TaxID=3149229 RepID=A0AAU7JN56_9HYPH
MGGVSIWHWIIVGIVVMLLFGRGKVSDLMGDVAKGIKSFKKGLADDETETATAATRPVEPARPLEDQRPAPVQTPVGERKVG